MCFEDPQRGGVLQLGGIRYFIKVERWKTESIPQYVKVFDPECKEFHEFSMIQHEVIIVQVFWIETVSLTSLPRSQQIGRGYCWASWWRYINWPLLHAETSKLDSNLISTLATLNNLWPTYELCRKINNMQASWSAQSNMATSSFDNASHSNTCSSNCVNHDDDVSRHVSITISTYQYLTISLAYDWVHKEHTCHHMPYVSELDKLVKSGLHQV